MEKKTKKKKIIIISLMLLYSIVGIAQSHLDMLKNAPVIHEQPCSKEIEFKQSICSFKDVDSITYNHINTSPVHDFGSVKNDIDDAIKKTFLMAGIIAIEAQDKDNVDLYIRYEYLDGIGGTLARATYPTCHEGYIQTMTFDNYDIPYGKATPDSIRIFYNDPKDIARITYHEVGHLLGFAHNDEDLLSMMSPYYRDDMTWSADDSLGFYLLFGPTDFIQIKKDDNYLIRPNFNISEFFSKCGGMNFHMLDKRLIIMAQKLADSYGSSIIITSSYRYKKCNEAAGGSKYSQHKAGRAIDFKFTNPIAHLKFTSDMQQYKYTNITGFMVDVLVNGNIGAIGLYNTHVHMDTRKLDKLLVFDKTNRLSEDGHPEDCGL